MNTNKEFILNSKLTPMGCIGCLTMIDHVEGTTEKLIEILERPYVGNKPNISSVPAGFYFIRPVKSPKFGDTYFLESQDTNIVGLVEGKRTHILFHSGNTIADSKGCLLTGRGWSIHNDKLFISHSRDAHSILMNALDGYDYKLTINRY